MSKTKQKLDQNTIHRVLKLIRPYTGMVILTLTFALITVVTTQISSKRNSTEFTERIA